MIPEIGRLSDFRRVPGTANREDLERREDDGVLPKLMRKRQPHDGVEAVMTRVDLFQRCSELQIDVRMPIREFTPQWNEPAQGERRIGADAQRLMLAAGANSVRSQSKVVEDARNIGSVGLADLGQFYGAAVAVEQGHAEVRFELLDLAADGTGCQAQFVCCLSKMQPSRSRIESAQGGQGRNTAHRGDLYC